MYLRISLYRIREPVEVTNIFAKFTGLSLMRYNFHIVSSNEIGNSTNYSTVFVPASSDRVPEPKGFLKIAYEGGKYELSWEPPDHDPKINITSFTIFWCSSKKDRPYPCTVTLI